MSYGAQKHSPLGLHRPSLLRAFPCVGCTWPPVLGLLAVLGLQVVLPATWLPGSSGGRGYRPLGCEATQKHRVMWGSQQRAPPDTSSLEGGSAWQKETAKMACHWYLSPGERTSVPCLSNRWPKVNRGSPLPVVSVLLVWYFCAGFWVKWVCTGPLRMGFPSLDSYSLYGWFPVSFEGQLFGGPSHLCRI